MCIRSKDNIERDFQKRERSENRERRENRLSEALYFNAYTKKLEREQREKLVDIETLKGLTRSELELLSDVSDFAFADVYKILSDVSQGRELYY